MGSTRVQVHGARGSVDLVYSDETLVRIEYDPSGHAGDEPAPTSPSWLAPVVDAAQRFVNDEQADMSGAVPAHVLRPWLVEAGLAPAHVTMLEELCRVPRGSTVTYAELAARAGHPGAARVAGTACSSNPFPLLVPCHRVVPSGRGLGGYSAPGGVATKQRLLEREGAHIAGVR